MTKNEPVLGALFVIGMLPIAGFRQKNFPAKIAIGKEATAIPYIK